MAPAPRTSTTTSTPSTRCKVEVELAQRRRADRGRRPEHGPQERLDRVSRVGQRVLRQRERPSDNVDAELRARGVDRASNLKTYFDGGFDIGGPILQDKLWFWGAYRYQDIERFITGTRNADGTFPIDRTFLWFPTAKMNWMPVGSHNVSGMYFIQQKKRFKRGLSALRPVETSLDQQNNPIPELYTCATTGRRRTRRS